MGRSPSFCARSAALLLASALAACSTAPPSPGPPPAPPVAPIAPVDRNLGKEVALFALGLVDTGYRFGGANPEAGLDCSGMVSWVYERVAGVRLPHNAAQIAGMARPVERPRLQPGDLVFFNTLSRPYSHVGIYIGDGRFVHAPSSRGQVRVDSIAAKYFAARFEGGRSLFGD